MAVVVPSAGGDGDEGADGAIEPVGTDEEAGSDRGMIIRKG